MSLKDKRQTFRHPLLSESVKVVIDWQEYVYVLEDISEGGIYCKLDDHDHVPKPKAFVDLIFKLPGDLGNLVLPGQVIRVNWMRKKKKDYLPGFAIKFGPIEEGNKKILNAYVTYLRNKQIISVSKRIIEEFFGDMRSPK